MIAQGFNQRVTKKPCPQPMNIERKYDTPKKKLNIKSLYKIEWFKGSVVDRLKGKKQRIEMIDDPHPG